MPGVCADTGRLDLLKRFNRLFELAGTRIEVAQLGTAFRLERADFVKRILLDIARFLGESLVLAQNPFILAALRGGNHKTVLFPPVIVESRFGKGCGGKTAVCLVIRPTTEYRCRLGRGTVPHIVHPLVSREHDKAPGRDSRNGQD